jgi:hypothetical protein
MIDTFNVLIFLFSVSYLRNNLHEGECSGSESGR